MPNPDSVTAWQILARILATGVAACSDAERDTLRREYQRPDGRTDYPSPVLLDRLRCDLPALLDLPPSGWTEAGYLAAGGTIGEVSP